MLGKIKEYFKPKEVFYRNPLSDGDLRNEPCICSSGKKVKHCHGSKYRLTKKEAEEIVNFANQAIRVGAK